MSSEFAYPAYRRIKRRRDFLRIQSSAKKIWSKHFLLLVSRSLVGVENRGEKGPTRFGITVTKKVDSRAVQRNRIKRLSREVFRHKTKELRPGLDLVIVGLRGATNLTNSEISSELCSLFKRGKLEKR